MITINYVWLGKGRLGALERFNVFTWKLAGCNVAIYAFDWERDAPQDVSSLGLDSADGVRVYDLRALLAADGAVEVPEDPRRLCVDMRVLLSTWYNNTSHYGLHENAEAKRDQIFNMVDLTKSYIGATRRGIVLDFKVGPSPHLKDYGAAFASKFIGFERGTLMAPGFPENQCMGTMAVTDTLRGLYGTHYNSKVKLDIELLKAEPTTKFCDFFTVTHANFFAFKHKKHTLNVTSQAPDGSAMDGRFEVREFEGAQSHGPFRVFKKAGDQTSQLTGERTTSGQVKALARYVWMVELPQYRPRDAAHYRNGATDAFSALPD